MKSASNFLAPPTRTIAIFAVMAVSVFAAKPTPEDDAKIVGNWKVTPPNMERVYEISSARAVRMMGHGVKDKTGQLSPRDDGSYTINLEHGAIERFTYDAAKDQLLIEYFDSKKTMDVGLVRWKSAGVRMPAAK